MKRSEYICNLREELLDEYEVEIDGICAASSKRSYHSLFLAILSYSAGISLPSGGDDDARVMIIDD